MYKINRWTSNSRVKKQTRKTARLNNMIAKGIPKIRKTNRSIIRSLNLTS